MTVRVGVAVMALALVVVAPTGADIGIRGVRPAAGSSGDVVTLTVIGFLGSAPHPPMPVVMVAKRDAPKPFWCGPNAFCSPRVHAAALEKPPYRLVATIRRWRLFDAGGLNGIARLRVRIPHVPPGRYVFGVYCERCTTGPKGSLILNERLALTVRR